MVPLCGFGRPAGADGPRPVDVPARLACEVRKRSCIQTAHSLRQARKPTKFLPSHSARPGAGPPRSSAQSRSCSVDAAASKALELVVDGARVGLGSGRAASAFISMLGARVRAGLRASGVATSRASALRARGAGIPLIELGDGPLDLTVDGADQVAPNLALVKGWGGALVRERIVAAASARQVIIVGVDKRVHALGERGRVDKLHGARGERSEGQPHRHDLRRLALPRSQPHADRGPRAGGKQGIRRNRGEPPAGWDHQKWCQGVGDCGASGAAPEIATFAP